jgi:hypothetical protein
MNFRAIWPTHPASSLSDISNTTILVTVVSIFHNLIPIDTKAVTFMSVCQVARQRTVRKKCKTLAHISSRGSNNKQRVIFVYLSWIRPFHTAVLDPFNATVTWPGPAICFARASWEFGKQSTVVLRWKIVRTEVLTRMSDFPCWCLMGIQKAK